MGEVRGLTGRVYLDANIFIYALEGYSEFQSRLTTLFEAIDRHDLEAVTSELTLAEVLVKPFRDGNVKWQKTYQQILQHSSAVNVIPVSRKILVDAAQIRARHSIKLPDAIHVTTAQQLQCENFLTNDSHFKAVSDLPVVLLSEWQP